MQVAFPALLCLPSPVKNDLDGKTEGSAVINAVKKVAPSPSAAEAKVKIPTDFKRSRIGPLGCT